MKYNLKTLSIAILPCLFANQSAAESESFFRTGFVSGMSIGYSLMDTGATKKTVLLPGNNPNQNKTVSNTASSNGLAGNIFAGYRYVSNSGFSIGFNLGFSLGSNQNQHTDIVNAVNTTARLSQKYQFTPGLFIGQKISERLMLFTEFSAPISRFEMFNQATLGTSNVSSKKQYTKIGFGATIGVEYAINTHFSITSTLGCELYDSKDADLGNLIAGQPATENHVRMIPRYYTARVGVLYKF